MLFTGSFPFSVSPGPLGLVAFSFTASEVAPETPSEVERHKRHNDRPDQCHANHTLVIVTVAAGKHRGHDGAERVSDNTDDPGHGFANLTVSASAMRSQFEHIL
jgi:hypothetical protein